MIQFSQLNLHKSVQANTLAGQAMEGKTGVISLLTEPHTIQNRLHTFPRGTTSVFDRNINNKQPGPRAAIVASRDLGINSLDQWCNRDCAAALMTVEGQQVVVASVYLDIRTAVAPSWLTGLIHMADRKSYGLIIGMDSNCHSTLFGPDNNRRGDEFEDLIIRHGLAVENTGTTPTFQTRRGGNNIATFIDVTLTKGLNHPIEEWHVDQGYNASDHNTIMFKYKQPAPKNALIRPWSKADWTKFSQALRDADYRLPHNMSMKKLDRTVQRMYDVLERALDTACPKITVNNTVRKNHWATQEHEAIKAQVSKLYQTAKKSGREADWQVYRTADREFKKKCNRDRNKAWREYKESLLTTKDTAALVKLAQRNERRDINVLTRTDGSVTNPGKETIDLLTETHFPAATGLGRVTYNNRKNLDTEIINEKYKDWISETLVRRALAGFDKKKSPGPDDIKPLIFEHLPAAFINHLTSIYKSSIHLGYTPKLWKGSKVIFISKPGKESYQSPKSFRPISLSNYFLKGLERLVGWRMDKALQSNPLHHKQHGFLSGKSTESAISNVTDYIESYIMKRQHCVGVFLDISSAFDTVRAGHIRQALLKHGGDADLVQWYHGYILHRDILIDMHGHSAIFSTGVGFPQGGVCSAKFWLIAFDYAIQIINRYQIEGNGYADDCAALFGGPRLDHALKRLQKMLDELTAWGKTCGLKFNPEKSVAVVFSRRRKLPPFALKLDGKEIEFRQEVKYLGVTLDKKLYWNTHINDKINKAKKFLVHVSHITNSNWGPKPELMRWAYLAVVRPMLCYGAMIWGHQAPKLAGKLSRINRMAMNTFANFPKSTPTSALEVILNVMPIHIFCQQEAMAAKARLHTLTPLDWDGTNKNKTHCTSHLRHWKNKLDAHNIDLNTQDTCRHTATKLFKTNTDSFDGSAKHRTPTQINIYTDGSRRDGRTGSGYVLYHRNREKISGHLRLPDYATVFQPEVVAVRDACRALLRDRGVVPRFVKIFIDSQATIRALSSPTITSKTVKEATDAINELAGLAKAVTLVWIPAHKGFSGNERADGLAKLGTLSALDGAESIYLPKSALLSRIRGAALSDWGEEWNQQSKAAHSKSFFSRPCPKKSRFIYKLGRQDVGRMVRLISGHNNLNFFQHKIGLWRDPVCRFCGMGNETITHLIAECPCFVQTSRTFFQGSVPGPDMKWSVQSFLRFSYVPAIDDALEGTWNHGGTDDRPDQIMNDSASSIATSSTS